MSTLIDTLMPDSALTFNNISLVKFAKGISEYSSIDSRKSDDVFNLEDDLSISNACLYRVCYIIGGFVIGSYISLYKY